MGCAMGIGMQASSAADHGRVAHRLLALALRKRVGQCGDAQLLLLAQDRADGQEALDARLLEPDRL